MKDVHWKNTAPNLVGLGITLDLNQTRKSLNWEQENCIEEDLKKAMDMYISMCGFEGCIAETLLLERLLL
jgi:hypothetical protein